jgi:hypothetical protein
MNAPATAVPTATPATVPAGMPFDGATDVVRHVHGVEDLLEVGDVVGEFDPKEPDSELVVMGPVDEEGLEVMEPGAVGPEDVTELEVLFTPILDEPERDIFSAMRVNDAVAKKNLRLYKKRLKLKSRRKNKIHPSPQGRGIGATAHLVRQFRALQD